MTVFSRTSGVKAGLSPRVRRAPGAAVAFAFPARLVVFLGLALAPICHLVHPAVPATIDQK